MTHIVTQYDTREQVFRQLQRDGIIISDKEAITSEIVSLSWLSACFKSGHILQVEDSHRLTKTEDTDVNFYYFYSLYGLTIIYNINDMPSLSFLHH